MKPGDFQEAQKKAAGLNTPAGSTLDAVRKLKRTSEETGKETINQHESLQDSHKLEPPKTSDITDGYAHQMIDFKQKLSDKLGVKDFGIIQDVFYKEFPKIALEYMPLQFQLKCFFSNLDDITCAISSLPSTRPVKIKLANGELSQQTYDQAVVQNYLESQVYDRVAKDIIPGKEMFDLYRQKINFDIDTKTGRPIVEYEECYTPKVINRFNAINEKTIKNKSDITLKDQVIIRRFIDSYLDLELKPEEILASGTSLLFVASRFGLDDCVKKLLDRGAEPNLEQGYGLGDGCKRTPLFIAAALNHDETIRELLCHETSAADPNLVPTAEDLYNKTAAHQAVEKSYLEAVRALSQNGADFSTLDSKLYITPLFDAVYNGEAEIIENILLSDKVSIDMLQGGTDFYSGKNALFITVMNYTEALEKKDEDSARKLLSITKKLVDYGANPSMVQQGVDEDENIGKTPISFATEKCEANDEMLEILNSDRRKLKI